MKALLLSLSALISLSTPIIDNSTCRGFNVCTFLCAANFPYFNTWSRVLHRALSMRCFTLSLALIKIVSKTSMQCKNSVTLKT